MLNLDQSKKIIRKINLVEKPVSKLSIYANEYHMVEKFCDDINQAHDEIYENLISDVVRIDYLNDLIVEISKLQHDLTFNWDCLDIAMDIAHEMLNELTQVEIGYHGGLLERLKAH